MDINDYGLGMGWIKILLGKIWVRACPPYTLSMSILTDVGMRRRANRA